MSVEDSFFVLLMVSGFLSDQGGEAGRNPQRIGENFQRWGELSAQTWSHFYFL